MEWIKFQGVAIDTMSGNLHMGGNRITGLPDSLPSTGSDAVSWLHVVGLVSGAETESAGKVSKRGDVMTGDLTLVLMMMKSEYWVVMI